MAWLRAALALLVAAAVVLALVSGGSSSDPRTPRGPAGLPPPFLGVALVGGGEATGAIDAYGDVVDLRDAPAGRARVEIPAARLAAGSVPVGAAIVPRARIGGEWLPLWRADSVRQRYLPGTNVVATTARFGSRRVLIAYAAHGSSLACLSGGAPIALAVPPGAGTGARCNGPTARRTLHAATRAGRRWLSRARPLGTGAPPWARRMYERSLLVLWASTARRSGAVAAGARDGWAYAWPRDAAAAVLAFDAAGYRAEARRSARFLLALDLGAAARFDGGGEPVAGRAAQGDAAGWVAVAARAAGLPVAAIAGAWRDRPDYQEKARGDYLANAIASTAGDGREALGAFVGAGGLVRAAGDTGSGADSAAAWAVRPFPAPSLQPAARRALLRLLAAGGRFGIVPSEDWPEDDPWTAPTAWSAWAFAALARADARRGGAALAGADRRHALTLLADLRRAATAAGDLPERVGARSGLPRSTTPLAWSHAFAILTLRELWPRH